jgi:hypothetical protein
MDAAVYMYEHVWRTQFRPVPNTTIQGLRTRWLSGLPSITALLSLDRQTPQSSSTVCSGYIRNKLQQHQLTSHFHLMEPVRLYRALDALSVEVRLQT